MFSDYWPRSFDEPEFGGCLGRSYVAGRASRELIMDHVLLVFEVHDHPQPGVPLPLNF